MYTVVISLTLSPQHIIATPRLFLMRKDARVVFGVRLLSILTLYRLPYSSTVFDI